MHAAAIYNPTTTGESVEVSYDPHRFRNSVRTKRKYLSILSVLLTLVGGAFLLYGAVFYSSLSSHIAREKDREHPALNTINITRTSTEPSWLHHTSTSTARSITLYAVFMVVATVMCAMGVAIWWHLHCRSVIGRRGRCHGDCCWFARFWRYLSPGMATTVEKMSSSQQQLHLLEAGNLPVPAPSVDESSPAAPPTAKAVGSSPAGARATVASDEAETEAMVGHNRDV